MTRLRVVTGALTQAETHALRALFDAEYRDAHGSWDPGEPYGYAGFDVRVLALDAERAVGHVGFGIRTIGVGESTVEVGGTGGMLVAPRARGTGLGRALMERLQHELRSRTDFGYLGCREEVVPFYRACGWRRIHAMERSLSRVDGMPVAQPPGPPILVTDGRVSAQCWPDGPIDLRGRPW